VGDLLSDFMANSKEGDIWITRQVHQNIVAVRASRTWRDHPHPGSEPASTRPPRPTRRASRSLVTDLPAFEIVGQIYKLIKP